MAGFSMPKRGSGAAMLRDLREDERPPLAGEDEHSLVAGKDGRPSLERQAEATHRPEEMTQGEMDRLETEMNQREVVSPAPVRRAHGSPDIQPNKLPYDNMINHMTEKLSDKHTEQKTGKQASKPGRKKSVSSVSQRSSVPVSQPESLGASQSVAAMIRERKAHRGEQEVLKTVTLKLSPTLDDKIETYCFENKMKKQEFWAEAAALYFEMIADEESI